MLLCTLASLNECESASTRRETSHIDRPLRLAARGSRTPTPCSAASASSAVRILSSEREKACAASCALPGALDQLAVCACVYMPLFCRPDRWCSFICRCSHAGRGRSSYGECRLCSVISILLAPRNRNSSLAAELVRIPSPRNVRCTSHHSSWPRRCSLIGWSSCQGRDSDRVTEPARNSTRKSLDPHHHHPKPCREMASPARPPSRRQRSERD